MVMVAQAVNVLTRSGLKYTLRDDEDSNHLCHMYFTIIANGLRENAVLTRTHFRKATTVSLGPGGMGQAFGGGGCPVQPCICLAEGYRQVGGKHGSSSPLFQDVF